MVVRSYGIVQNSSRFCLGTTMRFDIQHQGNVHGGELAHRLAIAETAGGMHPVELAGEGDDMLARGDVLAPHHA